MYLITDRQSVFHHRATAHNFPPIFVSAQRDGDGLSSGGGSGGSGGRVHHHHYTPLTLILFQVPSFTNATFQHSKQ